eukprot:SAG11_NODE_15657_length_570_cov_1.295117_1_plen_102_part_10
MHLVEERREARSQRAGAAAHAARMHRVTVVAQSKRARIATAVSHVRQNGGMSRSIGGGRHERYAIARSTAGTFQARRGTTARVIIIRNMEIMHVIVPIAMAP